MGCAGAPQNLVTGQVFGLSRTPVDLAWLNPLQSVRGMGSPAERTAARGRWSGCGRSPLARARRSRPRRPRGARRRWRHRPRSRGSRARSRRRRASSLPRLVRAGGAGARRRGGPRRRRRGARSRARRRARRAFRSQRPQMRSSPAVGDVDHDAARVPAAALVAGVDADVDERGQEQAERERDLHAARARLGELLVGPLGAFLRHRHVRARERARDDGRGEAEEPREEDARLRAPSRRGRRDPLAPRTIDSSDAALVSAGGGALVASLTPTAGSRRARASAPPAPCRDRSPSSC